MPAKDMRALVRGRIESLLPEHALHVAKVAEDEERKSMKMWAGVMERHHG